MSKFVNPLNNVKIASPCSADWDQMYGNERSRFCGDCKLNVYNLSGMTKNEAETLIMNAEGRLCVRLYQRADGTIITDDCPVGWAGVKHRTKAFATAAFSLVVALFSGVLFASMFNQNRTTVGQLRIPFTTPTPYPTAAPKPTMGAMVAPNPDDYKIPKLGEISAPPKKKRMKEIKIEAPTLQKTM